MATRKEYGTQFTRVFWMGGPQVYVTQHITHGPEGQKGRSVSLTLTFEEAEQILAAVEKAKQELELQNVRVERSNKENQE